jgi:DNA-binding SARP family transcriptional activator
MSVRKVAIVILVIIKLIFSFNAFSQKHINGLLFSSSAERINDRTSLILFDNSPLKVRDSFRVDFDLSIWDVKQFGYIFRVVNENKQEINFSFVNFYGNDKIYLDFHSPITHKSVLMPITLQDIDEKRWLPISIIFDLKTDRAKVIWKEKSYFCEPIGLKNPSHIKLAFGLFGLNLDVPRMAIRNICVEELNGKKYDIQLNEVAGEVVRDNKGRVKGKVNNPNWLANRYFYWQEKTKIISDSMARVAYDEKANRVIVADKHAVSTYSMRYDTKEEQRIENYPFTLNPGEAIYDNRNELLYVYNLEQKIANRASMAIINMKDYTVTYKYAQLGNRLYHHNAFFGGDNNELYVFGGYGNHQYSNSIYKYNLAEDSWDKVSFTGDQMYPRYFSASGQCVLPTQILIMGGVGNESGRQEHGGRHLYDLFSLNLNNKQIKKIWEIKEELTPGFVPCSNLILDEEKKHFYTLCYPQHQVNSVLQLYKFSMEDGSYQIVSDSIRINAEQIETTVYLYYNKLLKEFYTVIRENAADGHTEIRIYSLLSTPVSFAELIASNKMSVYWMLLLIPLVLAIVWYFTQKKQKVVLPEIMSPLEETEPEEQEVYQKKEIDKKNAVFVFGDFTVFDKNGRDISYRFSSKLRSLFALILFYSTDNNRISTDMLTAELWPDKDSDSAKNTRGVTINRLRGILADISGITLFHENSKWYFSFDPSFYCDYIEYKETINELRSCDSDENEKMTNLFEVLKRGTLYPSLQESWIDAHKHEYENEIYKTLWNYILKLNESKKYSRLIEFADLYFLNDPLNEDVLKLAVNALQKIGKKDQAILLYNKFVYNYKKSMGEEPNLSLLL